MVYIRILEFSKSENREGLAERVSSVRVLLDLECHSKTYFRAKFQMLVLSSMLLGDDPKPCIELAQHFL
jgi:hypothetical protein